MQGLSLVFISETGCSITGKWKEFHLISSLLKIQVPAYLHSTPWVQYLVPSKFLHMIFGSHVGKY